MSRPDFIRPLGAAPLSGPRRRHGPCATCGTPITVRAHHPLVCFDCQDRGVARTVAGIILCALGLIVALITWYAQTAPVTP